MRASEYIRKLQAVITESGDRELTVFDEADGSEHAIHADPVVCEESPDHESVIHIVIRHD